MADTKSVVDWAAGQASNPSSNYYRQCQFFVRNAFGAGGGAPNASAAWQAAKYKHAGDDNPPAGAALYWTGGDGHAAISAGNGMAYSTDVLEPGKVSLVPIAQINQWLGKKHAYAGWSEDVNGVRATLTDAHQASAKIATDVVDNTAGDPQASAQADTYAQAGWARSVIDAVPELHDLYQLALTDPKGKWTADRFGAEVRNTKWYQTTTETARKNLILQKSDPASWAQNRRALVNQMKAQAGTLGASVSDSTLYDMATHALAMGWTTDDINRNLATAVDWGKAVTSGEPLGGQAGGIEADIRKTADAYGVKVSDKFIGDNVKQILTGSATPDGYLDYFKNVAKQTYGAYAKQIDAGMTVDQIAEPYKQSMASTLELNPDSLTLADPTLRKTLMAVGDDGTTPASVPVWKFENQLRTDPRWLQTNNARQSLMGTTQKILTDWGVTA